MKRILSFLMLATVCMGTRCGCSGDDPCDNAPACESVVLGTLKLDPASSAAIPFKGQEMVIFENQQGRQIHFKAQNIKTDVSEKYVTKPMSVCGNCSEHYLKEKKYLWFQGTGSNSYISYELLKNMPERSDAPSGYDPITAGDALNIFIGGREFALSLDSKPVELNSWHELKLHDSLILGPKTYRDVYDIYIPNLSSTASSETEATRVYYTKADGVVGYYLGNKELWYKK